MSFSLVAENMSLMMVTAMLKNFYLYLVPYQRKGQAVEKDKQAESLYPAFCQRTGKMGANMKAERSEPVYK